MCCKLLKKQEKLLQKNVRFTIEKPIGGGKMKMGRRFFERGRPEEESQKTKERGLCVKRVCGSSVQRLRRA